MEGFAAEVQRDSFSANWKERRSDGRRRFSRSKGKNFRYNRMSDINVTLFRRRELVL